MSDDPFAPLGGGKLGSSPSETNASLRVDVRPIPPEWEAKRPTSHRQLGKPTKVWAYRDAAGDLLGYICRFDPEGGKEFRPLCLHKSAGGEIAWRWEAWRSPRPLYGLDRLAKRPAAVVIVTEGEKSADAAEALLPDFVAVTSPNGSKGAAKADWSALKGRDVIIWPDADPPGEAYLAEVAALASAAGASRIRRISPPDNSAAGWDAGDAQKEGWSQVKAAALIGSAHSIEQATDGKTEGGGRRAPRQRDQLIAAADDFELWHSPDGIAHATIAVKGHKENFRLDSAAFRRHLAGRYFHANGNVPSGQLLGDGIRILEVKALDEGASYETFSRIGREGENVWIDLCNDDWDAVRVTRDGFKVVSDPPIKFLRSGMMLAMPEPEDGGRIEELRGFINASDDDFRLIVGWVLGALWGRATSFPVLAVGGEQGSGKSTVSRLLRTLTDPSIMPIGGPPKDERDLAATVTNQHVLALDNMSKIEAWLSDAICRIATGGGFITRRLHTDFEVAVFQGSRPTILNGIPSLTDRADLAERSLTVRLNRINADERMMESEWWSRWEKHWPSVFGALLNALSGAIRHFDEVKLKSMPRMADFAHLMAAAEGSLGWEPGDFAAAYEANLRETNDAVFEGDQVAVEIDRFIRHSHAEYGWEGTATMLLAELNQQAPDEVKRGRMWPVKVNALGNAVDRAAPLLRRRGIEVHKYHTGASRMIRLVLMKSAEE